MTEVRPGFDALLPAMLIGFLVAAIFAWPVYKVLLAMKSRQTVSQYVPEHAAKQGTPTMGGIIICIGFLASCIYLGGRFAPLADHAESRSNLAFPVLFFGFMVIGFVDDFVVPRMLKGKRGLGWTQKLAMQIAVAAGTCFLLSPSLLAWELGLIVFLILFFSNAYNFADGLDWLATTLLLAMLVGYGVLAKIADVTPVIAYMGALGAAALPFMFLNRPPAKVFMGDVGALPIGAVIGLAVAVTSRPQLAFGMQDYRTTAFNDWMPTNSLSLGVALGLAAVSFMMVAELVPVPLQILSVKLRKGKRIFLATPIHHSFQRMGWKESRVVLAFFTTQVVCSILGVALAMAMLPGERAARVESSRERMKSFQRQPGP